MDAAENGLMAASGNIGKESFDALNGPGNKIWTKEELDGRILVSCKAARDGLEPFIDRRQPFGSMSDACNYYCDLFFKKTENEGIMLNAKVIIPNEMRFDISFFSSREKCGEMVIRVEK